MGSVADWIAAIAATATATMALPAVWYFLKDRQATRDSALRVEFIGAGQVEGSRRLRVRLTNVDPMDEPFVTLRILKGGYLAQLPGRTQYDPRLDVSVVQEPGTAPSKSVGQRMKRYSDEPLDTRTVHFDISRPGGSLAGQISVSVRSRDRLIASRKIKISSES